MAAAVVISAYVALCLYFRGYDVMKEVNKCGYKGRRNETTV